MIYLATPSSEATRQAMSAGLIGCMTTPRQGNPVPPGSWWAADNGAFGKKYVGDQAWFVWLTDRPWSADRCLFATAPDVVGDAAATLARATPWLPRIRALGLPAALVAQNGLEDELIPWDEFDVLFLGGGLECAAHGFQPAPVRAGGTGHAARFYCPVCSTRLDEWKLGPAAAELANLARAHGKAVHMGRVNSAKRLAYAEMIGCDSADGTFLAFGPDRNLPQLLAWQAQAGLAFPA